MSSEFGTNIKLSLFGESHGPVVGIVIDNFPSGVTIDYDIIDKIMRQRSGGKSYTTSRLEADKVNIVSGVFNNKTTGAPLCILIENKNFNSASYETLKNIPRPGHADYPAYIKYHGHNDTAGGGHFSGRLSAPLCAFGAICADVLKTRGIHIAGHIYSIFDIYDDPFDMNDINDSLSNILEDKEFPVINDDAGTQMIEKIISAAEKKDSVGGIVECAVSGFPVGIGNPLFDGVENKLSAAMFALGGIRGIEFGLGFKAAEIYGSEHNDPFTVKDDLIRTVSNNHGGILGGITSGMPIVFRVAVKPTPSIGIEQNSIDLIEMKNKKIVITGRHDPCIVPRITPCVKAMTAIVMLDLLIGDKNL